MDRDTVGGMRSSKPDPPQGFRSPVEIFHRILIEKYQMKINPAELSLLASISNGYTAGQILESIEQVISIKQKENFGKNLCSSSDFLPILGLKTPVFIDEENQIKVCHRSESFSFFSSLKTSL